MPVITDIVFAREIMQPDVLSKVTSEREKIILPQQKEMF